MYQKDKNCVDCWIILIILSLALSEVTSYNIKHPVVQQQPEEVRQPHVTQAHQVDGAVKLFRTPPFRVSSYAAPLIPSAPASYGPIVGITSPVKTSDDQTTLPSENEEHSKVTKREYEETTSVEQKVEEPETTTFWILDTTNIGASSYEGTTASPLDASKVATLSTDFR